MSAAGYTEIALSALVGARALIFMCVCLAAALLAADRMN